MTCSMYNVGTKIIAQQDRIGKWIGTITNIDIDKYYVDWIKVETGYDANGQILGKQKSNHYEHNTLHNLVKDGNILSLHSEPMSLPDELFKL